jgi:hypothetical protein
MTKKKIKSSTQSDGLLQQSVEAWRLPVAKNRCAQHTGIYLERNTLKQTSIAMKSIFWDFIRFLRSIKNMNTLQVCNILLRINVIHNISNNDIRQQFNPLFWKLTSAILFLSLVAIFFCIDVFTFSDVFWDWGEQKTTPSSNYTTHKVSIGP